MVKTLSAHFLPELTTPAALAGVTVVVIDVLRASTTIAHALAAGAREVIPFLEVYEVQAHAAGIDPATRVLGGERGGQRIERFDLGNSPGEYATEVVAGKTVLFTTTNGTKAMEACRQAERVLIGAPVNLSAVCAALAGSDDVHLVCAGSNGHITREDILAAGAITYQLCRKAAEPPQIDDAADVARSAWRNVVAGAIAAGEPLARRLADEFRATRGGRNLLSIGHQHDLAAAADVDGLSVVPELDVARWRIHLP